ncbi:MAG: hypothetical protein ACNA7Q_15585, partial [Rhodobacterales bacterium]
PARRTPPENFHHFRDTTPDALTRPVPQSPCRAGARIRPQRALPGVMHGVLQGSAEHSAAGASSTVPQAVQND